MSDEGEGRARTGSHTFVLPPRHRLFAIFDAPQDGWRAVEALRAEGWTDQDDVWVYTGQDGLVSLDPAGRSPRARLVRLAERVTSADVDYLRTLDEAVRGGAMVIAVRTPDEAHADHLAAQLQALSAHSFAFGAHWDFVPVVPEAT